MKLFGWGWLLGLAFEVDSLWPSLSEKLFEEETIYALTISVIRTTENSVGQLRRYFCIFVLINHQGFFHSCFLSQFIPTLSLCYICVLFTLEI